MTQLVDAIRQAKSALADVVWAQAASVSDDELVAALTAAEELGRVVDAARIFIAADVAERSRYELGAEGLSMRLSQRKPIDFIEQQTRTSKAEASRRVRIGAAVRTRQSLLGGELPPERPLVSDALAHGLIGADAAQSILLSLTQAVGGSEATPENMDAAELALVQLARTDAADDVADLGRAWRDALDPDGIEPRFDEIHERRMVTIGRERNGIKNYIIKADPPTSALLDAIFLDSMDKKVGPRFLSDDDRSRATVVIEDIDGEAVETMTDPRSLEQKRINILAGVLTAGLRATRTGPADLRTVGSVTAVISLKDLQSGTGFGVLEGSDEVIPAAVVQQLVCESGFYPVVVGNLGQPLYHGPLVRNFTSAQRRAMIARDGDRCVAPGCKTRAAACHAHHVIFYADNGPTDIDNGVLLCPAHHHALHQGAFELRMIDAMPYQRNSTDRHDDFAWKAVSHNRLALLQTA